MHELKATYIHCNSLWLGKGSVRDSIYIYSVSKYKGLIIIIKKERNKEGKVIKKKYLRINLLYWR